MTFEAAAAVVLKIGSLSGAASFAWQCWRAWDERRARLSVETTRHGPASLRVAVVYRPKSRAEGLVLRARRVRPDWAGLAWTDIVEETLEDQIGNIGRQLLPQRDCDGPLRPLPGSPGAYEADVFVGFTRPGRLEATLWLEVRTSSGRRLGARRIRVSPTD